MKLEFVELSDFRGFRDKARFDLAKATEDLWDLLCEECYATFNEWCLAQNDCACEED